MARENLSYSDSLLSEMRVLAEQIKREPGKQTKEAILFVDYFTDLDMAMQDGRIPRDWVPI